MKFKIPKILFLISLFLFFFDLVLAIGIGAKPSFLDLELRIGKPEETEILVYNISQEAGIFQVSPDELNKWIKVEPDSFRLEAGENKKVKITVLAEETGIKATNLSVLAKPVNRRSFGAFSGVKIPLRLNAEGEKPTLLASVLGIISQDWVFVTITLVILLLVFFLAKYFKVWELFRSR